MFQAKTSQLGSPNYVHFEYFLPYFHELTSKHNRVCLLTFKELRSVTYTDVETKVVIYDD